MIILYFILFFIIGSCFGLLLLGLPIIWDVRKGNKVVIFMKDKEVHVKVEKYNE